jgi:uncharacterized protein (UPF0261 family)
VDKEEWDDPEADRALLETLKSNLRADIKVIECDLHINDVAFAHKAAEIYSALYAEKRKK